MRIGTRGSALALAQARPIAEALGGELVTIRTGEQRGEQAGAPQAGGDKARFVREIEHALLDGRVELGVHSAKDLPGELPEGLRIAAVPAREDPRDVLVGAPSLEALPSGARVGTSSLRRRAQLAALHPDLEVVAIRGNVDTRLGMLAGGELDGLVLAAAGLRRLGRATEAGALLDPGDLVPAAGQGALALEARSDDPDTLERLAQLNELTALVELTAERAVVTELEATCSTPLGALARLDGDELALSAFVGLPDGSDWIRDELQGSGAEPAALGREMAERLRAAGGGEILEAAEAMAAGR